MHKAFSAAGLLACATPAAAVVFHSETVASPGGSANAFNSLTDPHVLQAGTTWITVSEGRFERASWSISGELARLWWDPFGDLDENGFVPVLTGNEYIYSPFCDVSTGTPTCGGPVSLRMKLSSNLLRIDFNPPPDYYTCTATFTVAGDCAETYSFGIVDYDLSASGTTGDVTFTFYDANPVPEPATWALMIAGFGISGARMRRRRDHAAAFRSVA